jgi:hypothetical protein
MSWLDPDSWLDVCAWPYTDAYVQRGGEAELVDQLEGDPRRLAALVGEPGAGTSRLAFELAVRRAAAWYRDPVPPPDPDRLVDELDELLREAPENARPVVVLDGPERDEALSVLAPLLQHALHPRLLVLVPCSTRSVMRLPKLGAEYPRSSILVAGISNEPRPVSVEQLPGDALAPIALAGRGPSGILDSEQELVESELVARHPGSATTVCLLGERARFEIAKDALLKQPDALTRALDAHPALRVPALTTTLRWLGGELPEGTGDAFFGFGPDQVPRLSELARRGIRASRSVIAGVTLRCKELLEGDVPPDQGAVLHMQIAHGLAIGGADDLGLASLRSALDLEVSAPLRGQLLLAIATAEADTSGLAAAADVLASAGDIKGQRVALARLIELQRASGQHDAALDRASQWLELERARGNLAGVAAASSVAATICGASERIDEAIEHAGATLEARRAVADVRGQALALYRIASLHAGRRQREMAGAALEQALALETLTGHQQGIGYCHWMMGAIAEQRADPAAARDHYTASAAAYERTGAVPQRLHESLDRASKAAAGEARDIGAERDAPLDIELPEDPYGEKLVQLAPRKKP